MLKALFGAVAALVIVSFAVGAVQAQTPPPAPPLGVAPPPPPPQVESSYWVLEGSTPTGPFPMSELRQRIAAGTMTADTYVWKDGMANWERVAAVAEVATLLPQTPVTPAGPDATMLHGTWYGEGPLQIPGVGHAMARMTSEYRPDGSFAAQGTMSMTMHGVTTTMQITGSGRWSAAPGLTGQLNVTTIGEMTLSGPGMPAQRQQVNDTSAVEIIDSNTIRDVSTNTTMRRVAG